MTDPDQYIALALQPSFSFVRDRAEIQENIERVGNLMAGAIWLSSSQLPVRLVTIPEGPLQGFWDEVTDMRHSEYIERIAIDIPGPETEALGKLARQYDTFIVCQARAKDPAFPGYYFNNAFIVDPEGEVIHRYAKLQVYWKEPSTTPLDIYDRWSEEYGWTLESLFPVVDTEIGRIGTMVCYDGAFPEIARGLAMNGAEIIYRCSYGEPFTGQGQWEIQNRARALDNTCYVVAPNLGPCDVVPEAHYPLNVGGGKSMIVDPSGQVLAQAASSGSTWAAATIDIASLRRLRAAAQALPTLKELSTEQYRVIYEQPIRERNFYADDPNKFHADRAGQLERSLERLVERGTWPASHSAAEEVAAVSG